MANKEEAMEKETVTGLETAKNRKEAEYDLVTGLLAAAEFKTAEENITEVEIKRNGRYLFTVHLRPISEPELRMARKKAITYMPNPQNKKLPPIEKDLDVAKFNSWIIYLGTTEEDQKKIWGNPNIMEKYSLAQPVDTIDILLTYGEKMRLSELVDDISGVNDEGTTGETTGETYAKN